MISGQKIESVRCECSYVDEEDNSYFIDQVLRGLFIHSEKINYQLLTIWPVSDEICRQFTTVYYHETH